MRRDTVSIAALTTAWLVVLATGCASVDYQRFGRCDNGDCGQRDENAKGIRYLGLSPYLIVHTNPNGTLNVRLEYLPDPHKKMSVLPKTFGAKIETSFEFERGALKKADTQADAMAVPKALLEAAKSILPAILDAQEKMASADERPHHLFPAPQIFKILVRGDKVQFVGSSQNKPFEITLLPEENTAGSSASTEAKDGLGSDAVDNGARGTNGNSGGES